MVGWALKTHYLSMFAPFFFFFRVYRGSQTFLFPIHLSESLSPSAIVYGTLIPIATYFVVKKMIIDPFLKQQKEQ